MSKTPYLMFLVMLQGPLSHDSRTSSSSSGNVTQDTYLVIASLVINPLPVEIKSQENISPDKFYKFYSIDKKIRITQTSQYSEEFYSEDIVKIESYSEDIVKVEIVQLRQISVEIDKEIYKYCIPCRNSQFRLFRRCCCCIVTCCCSATCCCCCIVTGCCTVACCCSVTQLNLSPSKHAERMVKVGSWWLWGCGGCGCGGRGVVGDWWSWVTSPTWFLIVNLLIVMELRLDILAMGTTCTNFDIVVNQILTALDVKTTIVQYEDSVSVGPKGLLDDSWSCFGLDPLDVEQTHADVAHDGDNRQGDTNKRVGDSEVKLWASRQGAAGGDNSHVVIIIISDILSDISHVKIEAAVAGVEEHSCDSSLKVQSYTIVVECGTGCEWSGVGLDNEQTSWGYLLHGCCLERDGTQTAINQDLANYLFVFTSDVIRYS